MLLLVGHGHPTFETFSDPDLGRLVQPRNVSSVERTAAIVPWAADNDAFNLKGEWDAEAERRYTAMLDRIAGLPGCRFVAIPDVLHETARGKVGDWSATLARFRGGAERVRALGLPAAIVLQDGLEGPDGLPWDELDAVFVGGSDAFKLGPVAAEVVGAARELGKWAHMGRVNSETRTLYARTIGCDSVDGTQYAMFPRRWIPVGLRWVKGKTTSVRPTQGWQMQL